MQRSQLFASDEGFTVYDLNPSGGHAGSADCKERLGG